MRRFLVLALTVFLFASAGGVALADGKSELGAAVAAMGEKDWASVQKHADAAIKSGELSGAQLGFAYYLRGLARWGSDDLKLVWADLDAAVRLLPQETELWGEAIRARMYVATGLKRWRDAAADFVTLAKAKPEMAREIDLTDVSRIVWRLGQEEEKAPLELLRTLVSIGYQPRGPGETLDALMSTYARLLVEDGKGAEALGILSKISDASSLIEARVDRRFGSLWANPVFDAATNPAEIAQRELSFWESRYRNYPTTTKVVTRYVMALRQVGEFDKAIAIARKALADVGALKSDKDDGDELWLRNELVYALKDLGKLEEMQAEMASILTVDPEKDGNVVSQLINFGTILVEVGRTKEGVDMAQRAWKQSSDFGKMFIQANEICAKAETDKAGAERILREMRKMDKENYGAMSEALLCLNLADEAAALVKKRLESPEDRLGVITAVQNYKFPPFVSPLRKALMERYQAIVARPDVRQKIDEYGRIETFPFIAGYWGNL